MTAFAPLAGLDPRGKLLAAAGLSVLVAVTRRTETALAILFLCLSLAAISGLGVKRLLGRAVAVNAFTLLLWATLPWRLVLSGDALSIDALRFEFSPAGLAQAKLLTLKINAAFLGLFALLGSSRPEDLFHALAHFRVPPKLTALLFLVHRYLHVLAGELARLGESMRLRGFAPRSDRHTWTSLANLVGSLLAKSFDRALRVHEAMLCRGFDGQFWLLDHFHRRSRDLVFAVCWFLLLLAAALYERSLL